MAIKIQGTTIVDDNQGLRITGISTFTTGPVLIGGGNSTGTASQPLQVSGGAYVSTAVGIGVTNPGSGVGLDMFGTGPHLRIATNATSGYGYIQIGRSATASQNWHHGSEGNNYYNFWNGNWGAGIGPLLSLYSAGSTTTHAVLINNATLTGTASQPLQVSGGAYVSGSLGVGVTNPLYETHIVGSADILAIESTLASDRSTLKIITNGSDWEVGARGSASSPANAFYIYDNAATAYRQIIDSSGNVIIGGLFSATGTASQALQVNSGAYVSGSVGIGITNPTNRFVIGGETVQFPQQLQVLSTLHSTSRRAAIAIGGTLGNQNPDWQILIDSTGNGTKDLSFYSTALNSSVLRIDTNGNTILTQSGSPAATGTASQALQVNSGAYVSGNLGVGITNPTSKLTTVGNLESRGTTSPSFIVTPTSGSSYIFGANTGITGGGIYDSTAATWRLVVKDTTGNILINTTTETGTASQALQVNSGAYISGNVAIGTISPLRQLHVLGNTTSSEFIMEQAGSKPDFRKWNFVADGGNATTASNFSLRLLNDAGSATTKQFWKVNGTNYTHSFDDVVLIGTATSTGTASQKLQVSGGAYVSGNLGIGSANPTQSLDVIGVVKAGTAITYTAVGGDSGRSIEIGLGGTSTLATYIDFHGADDVYSDYAARIIRAAGANQVLSIINRGTGPLQLITSEAGSIDFYTNNTFRHRIDSAGNVGIGISNPTQTLHVQGTARLTGALYDTNNVAGTSGQVLQSTGAGVSWATAAGGSGNFDTGISSSIYVSVSAGLGTNDATNQNIFTAPGIAYSFPSTAGTEYVIESIHVCNKSGNELYIVGRQDYNVASNTWRAVPIANRVIVPYQGAVELLEQPTVANPQDIIRLQALTSVGTDASGHDGGLDAFIVFSTKTDTNYVGIGSTINSTDQEVFVSSANPSVVQSIHLANYNNNIDVDVSVSIFRGGTVGSISATGVRQGYLAYNLTVPKNSTVEICEKPKYLAKNDSILVTASTVGSVGVTVAAKYIA